MLINEKRAYETMDKYGLDVLIASTKGNVTYATDYWPLLYFFKPGGAQAFCIIPRDKKKCPAIVMPMMDLSPWINCKSWVEEIWSYGSYYVESFCKLSELSRDERRLQEKENELRITHHHFNTPLEALVSAIRDKGFSNSKIGLDEMNISPQDLEIFRKEFSKANIIFAYEIFREIRKIKTSEEIKRIRVSTEITERAAEDACEAIKEGITEIELVNIFQSAVGKQGAIPSLTYFGCGTGSSLTDRNPTNYRLKKGDFVMFDVGCIYQHYHSDIARTVVLGEPSSKQIKYYQAIKEGRSMALNILKPGVKAKEIFEVTVKSIRDSGIPHFNRHMVGHSTGVEPYDLPIIGPDCNLPIEENMVINIETPYYELGFGGIQLEDTFLINSKGFEYISSLPQELRIIR